LKIATIEDLPEISEMSMKFMSETGYTEFSDQETIDNLIKSIVTSEGNERIIILEPGVGFLAGCAVPFVFGPHLLATEIAWYVVPEERGKKIGSEFLHAFEYWAREKAGCTMITMICLDDRLDKFYNNEGYKLYERSYMKVL
jgi:GNAT superfamily N-acetyltransferase